MTGNPPEPIVRPRRRRNYCDTCTHYQPYEDIAAGQCRRHAPRPGVDGEQTAFWPAVLPTDWCSEFG